MTRSTPWRIVVQHRFFLAAMCLCTAAITVRAASEMGGPPAGSPQTPAAQAQAAAPAAGFVGSATCETCHTQGDQLKGTPHAQIKDPRSPAAAHGCESCHGPGQAHVNDENKGNMRKFAQMPASEVSNTCLTCHNRGDHAGWEGSAHDRRDLSCASCHSVHSPKSFEQQLVQKTETELCATCHRLQVAKTERAVAHMPVREGKMSCSSCHNPHGSISNVKALKVGSSIAESCMSCHAEMRAPMVWEHAPVKESCATCHDPHGSSNDRMLVARMPMLCQRCHVATRHPSNIYDNNAITVSKSNRMFGRSCVNCHSNVHGSNHPSGQFFMR
jgi:DmsE family decaheme c-type cytochrome